MSKKIGILTSGGDCSGLNAAIRAVTLYAREQLGWGVLGIFNGTTGLVRRPLQYKELTLEDCNANMLRNAGTFLGSTTKENPFNFPVSELEKKDMSDQVIEGYNMLGLDALIAIGGDGSMQINKKFMEKGGMNIVAIPKTIDNDLAQTDYAIGYSTAVSVATEALDRLQPTAASHQRVIILEVMGRDAGHIALSAGVAGGADVILIPEIPYNIDSVCDHIKNIQSKGRNFVLIIVAEAVKNTEGNSVLRGQSFNDRPRYGGISQFIATQIEQKIKADTRYTVLGHVQRGGMPNAQDRILAANFGVKAVDLIRAGDFGKMVVWHNNSIGAVPIADTINHYNRVEESSTLLKTARALWVYVGESNRKQFP